MNLLIFAKVDSNKNTLNLYIRHMNNKYIITLTVEIVN